MAPKLNSVKKTAAAKSKKTAASKVKQAAKKTAASKVNKQEEKRREKEQEEWQKWKKEEAKGRRQQREQQRTREETKATESTKPTLDLSQMNDKQLKAELKKRGCKGYSSLKRPELEELLKKCPTDNCIKSMKKKCEREGKICNPKTGRCISSKKSEKPSRVGGTSGRQSVSNIEKKQQEKQEQDAFIEYLLTLGDDIGLIKKDMQRFSQSRGYITRKRLFNNILQQIPDELLTDFIQKYYKVKDYIDLNECFNKYIKTDIYIQYQLEQERLDKERDMLKRQQEQEKKKRQEQRQDPLYYDLFGTDTESDMERDDIDSEMDEESGSEDEAGSEDQQKDEAGSEGEDKPTINFMNQGPDPKRMRRTEIPIPITIEKPRLQQVQKPTTKITQNTIKDFVSTKLSTQLLSIDSNNKNYLKDSMFVKDTTNLLTIDPTRNVIDIMMELANIITYMSFDTQIKYNANIFRDRLRKDYYTPSSLTSLSMEDKIPEVFSNNLITDVQKEMARVRINNSIKETTNDLLLQVEKVINPTKRVSQPAKPPQPIRYMFKREIKKSLLKSQCKNKNQLVGVNDYELIKYRENGNDYCLSIKALSCAYKNGMRLVNSSTGNLLDELFVNRFIELYENVCDLTNKGGYENLVKTNQDENVDLLSRQMMNLNL